MSQVELNNVSATSSFGELGPTTSLQLMFAKLQLELATTAKTQAMDKMDAIAKVQDEQKLVSQLLNEARRHADRDLFQQDDGKEHQKLYPDVQGNGGLHGCARPGLRQDRRRLQSQL